MRVIAVGVVLAWPLWSHAEPTPPASSQPATQPTTYPTEDARAAPLSRAGQPAPRTDARLKSPQWATIAAVALTVIPATIGAVLALHVGGPPNASERYLGIALLSLGVCVGPSAGHLWAGEYGTAALRSLIRTATFLGGGALIIHGFGEGDGADSALGALLGMATLVWVISDWADAAPAVERANRRSLLQSARLVPFAGLHGGPSTGLALVGRF
jgi:hypothetical protein